jgi:hypothetical protein
MPVILLEAGKEPDVMIKSKSFVNTFGKIR